MCHSLAQIIMCMIFFNVCGNHTMFKLEDKNTNHTICSYISYTLVTLKPSQGHQTQNDNVDPKQGHNHAKF